MGPAAQTLWQSDCGKAGLGFNPKMGKAVGHQVSHNMFVASRFRARKLNSNDEPGLENLAGRLRRTRANFGQAMAPNDSQSALAH